MSGPNKYAWEKVVRDTEALNSKDKLVAFIMGTYANKDGWNVMVSQETLARQVGSSLSTIERAVRSLANAGFIEQTRRAVNRGPNPGPAHYRLTIPLSHWQPVPEGMEVRLVPFHPTVENKVHPSPMTAQTKVHPSPMTVETEWWEDSPVISDGFTRHFDPIDPSNEVDSPVTRDGLTVFNRSSTEQEEHFGTTVPSRTPLRSADAGSPPRQPPLMQSVPTAQERYLPMGQPRAFLESKLGRELLEEEEALAARMDAKGSHRAAILSAIQSIRQTA